MADGFVGGISLGFFAFEDEWGTLAAGNTVDNQLGFPPFSFWTTFDDAGTVAQPAVQLRHQGFRQNVGKMMK